MSKRGDIYHGSRKIGEIHEVRDYEGELAVGIAGCLLQIAVYALIGIFILTWRYPKVMLPLIAVVTGVIVLSNNGQSLHLWSVPQSVTRVASSTVAAATRDPQAILTATADTGIPNKTIALIGTVTSYRLNVRTGPGANYSVAKTLSKDDKVTVQGRNELSDWLNISYNGGTGWVAAKYIALQSPIESIPLTVSTMIDTNSSDTSAPKSGMWVVDVEAGSEAAGAGFQKGQVLVSLNGQVIEKAQTANEIVARNVGLSITAVVWENGKERTITVRPKDKFMGLTLCQLARCSGSR